MTGLEFSEILKNEFSVTDNAKILKCNRIAYESAKDAHRGLEMSDKYLFYIGRDFLIDLMRDGDFNFETMEIDYKD